MSLPQTAIVTGSTSGIGLEIARQLDAAGYQVVTNGTREIDRVPDAIQPPLTHYVQGDIGDPATAKMLIDGAHQRFGENLGRLVVVANAGIERTDTESADRVQAMIRTNQDGPEHLLRAAAPDLLRNDNSLFVAVSSIVGTLGIVLPGNKNYQATKVAVEAMVRGVAANFVGVHAITLSPGAIATPMTQSSPVYGLLLRYVAMYAATHEDEIGFRLCDLMDVAPSRGAGQNAGEIFVNVLGQALEGNPAQKTLAKVLAKDPSMQGTMAMMLSAKTAQHPPTQKRMAEILTYQDILVPPSEVAARLMDEILLRQIPDGGVLRVFQAGLHSVSPIERLFVPS